MVHVMARAIAKPEHVGEVRTLLRKLVKASRAEPGVLTYNLFEAGQTGEFHFYEVYANADAFESHKASRHIAVFAGRALPLLHEEFQVWTVEPVEPA